VDKCKCDSKTIGFKLIWKRGGQTDGHIFAWLPVSMQAAYMFLALMTAAGSWEVTASLKIAGKIN
jgi:hypothetical protein